MIVYITHQVTRQVVHQITLQVTCRERLHLIGEVIGHILDVGVNTKNHMLMDHTFKNWFKMSVYLESMQVEQLS